MTKFPNLFSLAAGLLLMLGLSAQAAGQAMCQVPNSMTLSLPSELTFDPNAAVGDVLYSISSPVTITGSGIGCVSKSTTMNFYGDAGYGGAIGNLYPTGIQGVAFRLRMPTHTCAAGRYWPISCKGTFGPNVPPHTLEYQLVKTGPTGSGTLSRNVGYWWGDANILTKFAMIYLASSVAVKPQSLPTCSFTAGSVQASLDNVSAKSFTGVGSTSPARPFSIDLACKGGDEGMSAQVYATLTDATDASNRSKVLSLSPGSQAKGVGIQVLHEGAVLGYGPDSSEPTNVNRWHAGTVATGMTAFSIPLAARYVQTDPVVTPGTANGRATFTMSYQ
ncbi:fimbrial protein [Achromobacter pestifer]|uniref:Fimbrial protein n=1 Tax=Achromobacter pestifer TaxID=1353889 RepID=A0A7D4HZ60_9BURK|nr:fimbrial protein [Achromobacter pestifer]QKH36380.1 fimbrial protein [Achromobacter pestifer]